MDDLQVGNMTLEFLDFPYYTVAHPGEFSPKLDLCTRCALGIRKDTGDIVLLWRTGNNFTVSRADPHYAKHKRELGD